VPESKILLITPPLPFCQVLPKLLSLLTCMPCDIIGLHFEIFVEHMYIRKQQFLIVFHKTLEISLAHDIFIELLTCPKNLIKKNKIALAIDYKAIDKVCHLSIKSKRKSQLLAEIYNECLAVGLNSIVHLVSIEVRTYLCHLHQLLLIDVAQKEQRNLEKDNFLAKKYNEFHTPKTFALDTTGLDENQNEY
jgi:hypothetical protein